MWNSLERFSLNEAFFQTPSTIRTHSGKLYSIKVKGKLCWGNPLCFCGTEKKMVLRGNKQPKMSNRITQRCLPWKAISFTPTLVKWYQKKQLNSNSIKQSQALAKGKAFFRAFSKHEYYACRVKAALEFPHRILKRTILEELFVPNNPFGLFCSCLKARNAFAKKDSIRLLCFSCIFRHNKKIYDENNLKKEHKAVENHRKRFDQLIENRTPVPKPRRRREKVFGGREKKGGHFLPRDLK